MMSITSAYMLGDMVQIHIQVSPNDLQADLIMPQDPRYADMVKLAKDFASGRRKPDQKYKGAPARQYDWQVWDEDSWAWIDPRTEAELEAELNAIRQATDIPASDFNEYLMEMGLVSPSDIEGLTIPAIIDVLPGYERTMTINRWKNATSFNRLGPVVLTLIAYSDLTDELFDHMFGIQIPQK